LFEGRQGRGAGRALIGVSRHRPLHAVGDGHAQGAEQVLGLVVVDHPRS
jgi:hypothetical protein